MTTLTEAEKMAIEEFLSEHWLKFLQTALKYLREDEIIELEGKLS